jgi:hypothetical protein
MILSVRGHRIIFQCDGAGGHCGRTISTEQGAMAAKDIFQENDWQAMPDPADAKKWLHLCAEHRRQTC